MKKTFLVLGFFAFISNATFSGTPPGKKTLSGKITDSKTGEALPGVTIYIPDLKTGTDSDERGNYIIDNLPSTVVYVQVTFVGYKIIVESVDLSKDTTQDFALHESVNELNEVVVTGLSHSAENNRTPTPISVIPPSQLLQSSSTNIIDALATQPGISQITTGAGISKPVIRGLGYNRVVVVNDGIRQEGQQWGDEHGIEIDEFSVDKVEILKGPASLTYGSDAMAGVINMISAPTLPEGNIEGNIVANYQTNNGLIGYSGNLAGNKKGFIWNLRYSGKQAHSYKNGFDGYVFNSGYREHTASGIIGLNKSWGFSHLHFSSYDFTPGIIEGERDSAGNFIKPTETGEAIAVDDDYKSYDPSIPYQHVQHYKAVLNNSIIIKNSTLKVTAGYQQNSRQEFSDAFSPDQYGLYFLLNTINYDVRLVLPEKKGFSFSTGVNGMSQSSMNKGSEFLIPEYNLFDIGGFALAKKSFGRLDVSGGIRYDTRNETADALYLDSAGNVVNIDDAGAAQKFGNLDLSFSAITGSIGATYQFSEIVFSKLNLSRGYRAPGIAELASNGVHEGTSNYIIGSPDLKAETSLQLDYAFGINSQHVTAEIDLFTSSIDNFIFQEKLNSTAGGDSLIDGYRAYRYSSGNANLSGGEIYIDIHPHPLDWLHFENSFSFVQSVQSDQPDSTKYLPFTPGPKITTELKAEIKKLGIFSNAYAKIEMDNFLRQDKFYSAYGTETVTPGYTLLNFGIGAAVRSKNRTLFSFYINLNNLGDVSYQNHLSRLKYTDVNQSTGRTGVYNMGRNLSLKLVVPLELSN